MGSELKTFGLAVWKNWLVLVTGGILAAGVAVFEHETGRSLSEWVYLLVLAIALFIATFLAWRDQYQSAVKSLSQLDQKAARRELRTVLGAVLLRLSDLERRSHDSGGWDEQEFRALKQDLRETEVMVEFVANKHSELSILSRYLAVNVQDTPVDDDQRRHFTGPNGWRPILALLLAD